MNKFFKNGQVTLVAVVLGVVGLTLGLAVASRSLSDLRQASTVDFGTKALAAAESGAEYALSRIAADPVGALAGAGCNGNTSAGLTFPGIQTVTYDICSVSAAAQTIPQDGVYQIDYGAIGATTAPTVYWTGAPGVEVVALYANQYNVARYAYQVGPSGISGSNFTVTNTTGTCGSVTGSTTPAVPVNDGNVANNLILLRVKPIKSAGTIIVCNGTIAVPNQQYQVTAKATTRNGLVKRVRVTRDISGVLPGVFDNVLYSGGSISKN